jgi:hypothetical protein
MGHRTVEGDFDAAIDVALELLPLAERHLHARALFEAPAEFKFGAIHF